MRKDYRFIIHILLYLSSISTKFVEPAAIDRIASIQTPRAETTVIANSLNTASDSKPDGSPPPIGTPIPPADSITTTSKTTTASKQITTIPETPTTMSPPEKTSRNIEQRAKNKITPEMFFTVKVNCPPMEKILESMDSDPDSYPRFEDWPQSRPDPALDFIYAR
ncbi:hypothetical protein TWF718_010898 [Orbilia javanica]|uniref:Uncharacterized protein n=1 Tax=Orbilia javanica TaxID=47235 RepID=A0AAN8RCZ9_9PEZI